jgi:hypothetical protein
MKPIHSVLKILDFSVLKMDFDFIAPRSSEIHKGPTEYFEEYELDLDFVVFADNYFQVSMIVNINNVDNPLPGYKIVAKVATIFEFGDSLSITPDQRKSIEGFSTIYMALNNMRGIIAGFTANAPCGRYILPSIDLNDLIKKKKELANTDNSVVKKPKNENKIKEKKPRNNKND